GLAVQRMGTGVWPADITSNCEPRVTVCRIGVAKGGGLNFVVSFVLNFVESVGFMHCVRWTAQPSVGLFFEVVNFNISYPLDGVAIRWTSSLKL
ncbi:MAG: hypothetical protein LAT83_18150, partial [Kiritimatiellae bacterium]|nr:hypothetical protein [Kiritimatiellia bacterium]